MRSTYLNCNSIAVYRIMSCRLRCQCRLSTSRQLQQQNLYEPQLRATLSQSRVQSSPCDRTWPRPPSAPVIGIVSHEQGLCRGDGKVNRGGHGLEVPCVYRLYGPKVYIEKMREFGELPENSWTSLASSVQ